MKNTRKLHVFLCHASQDKPAVRELYGRLLAENWIDPWLDEEKLLPGQEWELEVKKAVETSDVVIACLSKNSVTKEGYVQKELRFALNKADEKPLGTLYIMPIRLEDCTVPDRLRIWQYVDFFPKDQRNKAFSKMSLSLESKAKSLGIQSVVNTTDESGFTELVLLVLGDVELANRLVEFEQRTHPYDKRNELIERAIERLLGDRREQVPFV